MHKAWKLIWWIVNKKMCKRYLHVNVMWFPQAVRYRRFLTILHCQIEPSGSHITSLKHLQWDDSKHSSCCSDSQLYLSEKRTSQCGPDVWEITLATGGALDLMTWFLMFWKWSHINVWHKKKCSSNISNPSFKWAHLSFRSAGNCGSLKENRGTRESGLMVIMNREGKAAARACG